MPSFWRMGRASWLNVRMNNYPRNSTQDPWEVCNKIGGSKNKEIEFNCSFLLSISFPGWKIWNILKVKGISLVTMLVEIPCNMYFGVGEEFNINRRTRWSKLNSFRANIQRPGEILQDKLSLPTTISQS